MKTSDQELLQAYSRELNLGYDFTLEDLIKAHRNIGARIAENDERYVSIEKLKAMTVDQLVDLVEA